MSQGYTLVETVVVIAIAGLLLVGLAMFVGRSFNVSREQFEQARITEDARLEMERISDAIRNARYIDLNGNGFTSDAGETWLQTGEDYAISVFTNIDADAAAERVRYFVETAEPRHLMRGVLEAPFTGTETVSVLMRSLENYGDSTPIFTYFGSNGTQIPAPVTAVNLAATARVGITLVVDVNPQQLPGAANVTTDVTPRSSICDAGNCQAVGNGCIIIPNIPLGPYSYVSNSFIEDGGQTCKAYCQTPEATSCCPWGATYSWDGGAVVTGSCACGEPTYPSPLPDNVNYGDYTQYYKDKWAYCNALGQFGAVSCDPTCELLPNSTGRCTWECQSG